MDLKTRVGEPVRRSKKQKWGDEETLLESVSEPESVWKKLPNDLEFDILCRLEGKEVGASKCVCTSWNSIIDSPLFLDAYRERNNHRVMLYSWSEHVPFTPDSVRFRVYCTRMSPSRPKEFRVTLDLPLTRRDLVTQVIDGLVCVAEVEGFSGSWSTPVREIALYNVCTGEKIVVPKPKTFDKSVSTFHLGHDPIAKKYKLLRVIYPCTHQGIFNGKMRAKVITLEPSSFDFLWRSLKYYEAGLDCFRDTALAYSSLVFYQARTFPGDRALSCRFCVFCNEGLILFDLNEERFRLVQFPQPVRDMLPNQISYSELLIVPRITLKGLSLWIVPPDRVGNEWYVMSYNNEWIKHCIQLPDGVHNVCYSSSASAVTGEFTLIDAESMTGYSYPQQERAGGFLIGRLPENRNLDHNVVVTPGSDWGLSFDAKLICLPDSTHSYISLAEVLMGLQ